MPAPLGKLPLLDLLQRGSDRFGAELLAVTAVSGLSNALLLAIINAATGSPLPEANGQYLALFGIVIALYIVTHRYILMTSVVEVERILHGIRVRISDRIRRSDLIALEGVGRAEIYSSLDREALTISQSTPTLIIAGQSCLMVLFSVFYLLWLSKTAFVLAATMTWIGLSIHFRHAAELNRELQRAGVKENEFHDALTHLLDGFKEVKLSEARSADLFAHLTGISAGVEEVKIRTGASFANHFLFAQGAFYVLIAGIAFLLPQLSPGYAPDVVIKATAAILFIIGPLGGIVNSIPILSRANLSSQNIMLLDHALASSGFEDRGPGPERPTEPVSRVSLRAVAFQYQDARGIATFSIGPLDLAVSAGEILFVVGGNGSGKSTLLKLLTGLYHPQSGLVAMDGSVLTPANSAWYRSHFSAVFSDYHLFDRLYGLRGVDPRRVEELLELMEIQAKTSYVDGRFSHIDLSSGQKKRLALVAALLENRPILVLDEWAADQDPPFRRYFYQDVLPDLKRQGKTIVAVTHDDRYFGAADRVVKMEYGQFVPFEGA